MVAGVAAADGAGESEAAIGAAPGTAAALEEGARGLETVMNG